MPFRNYKRMRRMLSFLGCLLPITLACNLSAHTGGNVVDLPGIANIASATLPIPVPPSANNPGTSAVASITPTQSPTSPPPFPYSIRETTRFEGEKAYLCDAGGCWRQDGTVINTPEYFYPDIEMENPAIQRMLDAIGLPATVASNDPERWFRTRRVWAWMQTDTVPLGKPGQEESFAYLTELMKTPAEHWPSIAEMANVYDRFHILPLGACNSKAFTFATLLYRTGVRPDSLSVAHTKGNGFQHMYVVLRIEGRWRFVDPTCIPEHPALSNLPESVGCVGADYAHPYQLEPLPGSHLTKPMLAE
jgi:hypothetical protein